MIIAPHTMKVGNEDEWGDLECPYTACPTDTTYVGLFADTGVNKRDNDE